MSADQTPPQSGRIRSSSVERERIVSILRAAAEAGLLSLDEADERMAACYASQYRDELAPLVADLPDGGRGLIPPDPEEQARDRRAERDEFGRHFGFVFVVSAVLVGIWALSGAGIFWPAWPLGFLAFTLLFHAKHRRRRREWRERLRSGAVPTDFRPYYRHHGHPCGHHGRAHRWAEEHSSRSW
ncbi:DUF1707 domain-containing protein [Cryptosporangium sp. NPDC051539]|uniref:DUF1707 domain-containing protein n=1 Tax=Cryptosporangium sp. NPDC051539 TaxID=3363962 RepID=UPI0037A3B990